MPALITFVAFSNNYALFGHASDPAAQIARMQVSTPAPIELVAGWIVPPRTRAKVLDGVKTALSRYKRRGDWINVSRERAILVLAEEALAARGEPWRVRKRPRPSAAARNLRDRPVVTPHGRYPSAKVAAEALGISRQAVWERAARQSPGWRFENEDRPAPSIKRRGRPSKAE